MIRGIQLDSFRVVFYSLVKFFGTKGFVSQTTGFSSENKEGQWEAGEPPQYTVSCSFQSKLTLYIPLQSCSSFRVTFEYDINLQVTSWFNAQLDFV